MVNNTFYILYWNNTWWIYKFYNLGRVAQQQSNPLIRGRPLVQFQPRPQKGETWKRKILNQRKVTGTSFIEKSVFYVVLTENSKFVDILKNLKIFLIGTILVNTLVVNILCNGRLVSIGTLVLNESTRILHICRVGLNPTSSTIKRLV